MKTKLLSLFLVVFILLSLTACSGSKEYAETVNDSSELYYSVSDSQNLSVKKVAAVSDSTTAVDVSTMLIKTADATVQTKTFDDSIAAVKAKVKEIGGYVESETSYKRGDVNCGYYTLRIPADKFDGFLENIGSFGHVTQLSSNVEDVTTSYADMVSRKESLDAQIVALENIFAQCTTVKETLEVQETLYETQQERNAIAARITALEKKVNYSTLDLELDEVIEYTEEEQEPALTRLGKGFVESCKGVWTGIVEVFVWLVQTSPYFLVIGGANFGIFWLIFTYVRKKNARKAAKALQESEQSK